MSITISEKDFLKFCSRYPQLAQIGIQHLGPKIWIMFNALQKQSVSVESISHNPCASLMENGVSFEDIKDILVELRINGLLYENPPHLYHLTNEIAYVLQQLSFDLTRQLPSNSDDILKLLQDCGYSSAFTNRKNTVIPLLSDDNNIKTSKFKELMSEVAFSGLKLIIKLINRTEEQL